MDVNTESSDTCILLEEPTEKWLSGEGKKKTLIYRVKVELCIKKSLLEFLISEVLNSKTLQTLVHDLGDAPKVGEKTPFLKTSYSHVIEH